MERYFTSRVARSVGKKQMDSMASVAALLLGTPACDPPRPPGPVAPEATHAPSDEILEEEVEMLYKQSVGLSANKETSQ